MTRALLRLREMILSGEFTPGERMSELALVERLGVSRTPVRLALAALEHEGLVRGLSSRGYVVSEFTQADISDAIELRGVLEGTAARFAAERSATADAVRELHEICDATAEEVHRADYESFERFVDLNTRFHARILRMAGSPMLERALEGIIALPFASPSAFVMAQAVLPESRDILIMAHRHHLGLVDAIERNQGTRAESLGREHALLARTNLEVVLDHPEVLERMPGASLLARPGNGRAGDAALERL
ncbi:MAG TPA: GntR family transcriptional regulator [Solirubrobacteraceae bacterium]|jgi:GntR family transcriptional regulator of vanillate catabolism|nr:GntR family transcriptional regulator [Solirubrobacteraceae bacterium]